MALSAPASAVPLRTVGYSSGSDEIALAAGGGTGGSVRTLASAATGNAWPQHAVASGAMGGTRAVLTAATPLRTTPAAPAALQADARPEPGGSAPVALLAACVSMIAFFALRNDRSRSN